MKILIVDDDAICRKVLSKMLESFGECDEAKDGREAIEAFRQAMNQQNAYDLICLDVMMPEVDGRSALMQMRIMEDDLEIPSDKKSKIIMTTTLSEKKDVEGAFKDECDSYVTKPIRADNLKEKLKQLGLVE